MNKTTVNNRECDEKDGLIPVDQIIKRLRNENYDLNKRTFQYYVQTGLLPKGKRMGCKGGGVQFYYHTTVVALIKKIFELKSQGRSLNSIKEVISGPESLSNHVVTYVRSGKRE